MPRRGKGSSSSSIRRAAITEAPSRLSSGRHSLQPVAMSVATSVHRKRPSIHLPQWATRSISSQPASLTSPQPLNVRTGVRRCTALRALGGRRQPLPGLVFRTGASNRSIVALLIVSSFSLTSRSRARWPWRSKDSSSSGSSACKRLPQSRSLASHSGTSASITSGP